MKRSTTHLATGVMALLLALSMGVHFGHNASSGVLGKDESLYIFLARGQYSHAPVDREPGSWLDAAVCGMTRTADPFGIFILLNAWQRLSGSEAWLRLLPYLLFAAAAVSLIAIARVLRLPLPISVACGFMPLGAYFMVNHAIEIRGYGLELALTYLMICVALHLANSLDADLRPPPWHWAAFGSIGILGMTSRFSFVINSGALFAVLLVAVLQKRRSTHFRRNIKAVLGSGTLVAVSFAALLLLRVHLTAADPLNAVPPDYDMYGLPSGLPHALTYLGGQIRLIPAVMLAGSGVLAPDSLPISNLLIAVAVIMIAVNLVINLARGDLGVEIARRSRYLIAFAYPPLAFAMVALLAFFGLHPLSVASRWGLFLHPSWHLMIIGTLRLALAEPGGDTAATRIGRWSRGALITTLAVTAVFYGVHYAVYRVHFRMGGGQNPLAVIQRGLGPVDPASIKVWYVSVGAANAFKHQLLYGALRNRVAADARIVIENRPVSVKRITAPELAAIGERTSSGDRIAMLIGHVNASDAAIYTGLFSRAFPSAVCGPHEPTNEQFCLATR